MDKNTLLQMQEAYRRQNQLLNNTSAISTPLVDKTALIQMQEDNRRQTPQFNDKTSMASMSLINEMVFHQIKEAYRRQNPRLNDDAITMATRQYILQMQTRTKALQNIYSPNIQRNPIPSTSIASVQNKIIIYLWQVVDSEENQVHNNKKLIIEKIGGNLINGNNVIPIEDIVEIEDTPNNNSFPIEDIIEKVATDNNKYNASSEDIVEITPIDNNKSLSIEKNGGKQIQEVVIDENGDNSKNSELSNNTDLRTDLLNNNTYTLLNATQFLHLQECQRLSQGASDWYMRFRGISMVKRHFDDPITYSYRVDSTVSHRYAITKVISIVHNPSNVQRVYRFGLVMPKTAFVSNVTLERGDLVLLSSP
ncbi:unnamed protein product [Lepeophtheirus salmonis]|uniref:(salmon louse) hypothetical protein n=1 Tax=Lepeophtheirus salmonis TaxID=72036 RepID=A0A7R8CG44_LEPSM|nr:unnamed protein product [Lepeophtheirus salmonis]CAF2812480.1 unnamed protein product [Lepeophtheirus salmonis]